jgi:hypothetical protein
VHSKSTLLALGLLDVQFYGLFYYEQLTYQIVVLSLALSSFMKNFVADLQSMGQFPILKCHTRGEKGHGFPDT